MYHISCFEPAVFEKYIHLEPLNIKHRVVQFCCASFVVALFWFCKYICPFVMLFLFRKASFCTSFLLLFFCLGFCLTESRRPIRNIIIIKSRRRKVVRSRTDDANKINNFINCNTLIFHVVNII